MNNTVVSKSGGMLESEIEAISIYNSTVVAQNTHDIKCAKKVVVTQPAKQDNNR